jgi:hypothetical protein
MAASAWNFPVTLRRLAWSKAQSCFTDIIRYQTRPFVPVDRAADILLRLMPG